MNHTEPPGAWRLPQPIRIAATGGWRSLRDAFAGARIRCVPAPGGFPALLIYRSDSRPV